MKPPENTTALSRPAWPEDAVQVGSRFAPLLQPGLVAIRFRVDFQRQDLHNRKCETAASIRDIERPAKAVKVKLKGSRRIHQMAEPAHTAFLEVRL